MTVRLSREHDSQMTSQYVFFQLFSETFTRWVWGVYWTVEDVASLHGGINEGQTPRDMRCLCLWLYVCLPSCVLSRWSPSSPSLLASPTLDSSIQSFSLIYCWTCLRRRTQHQRRQKTTEQSVEEALSSLGSASWSRSWSISTSMCWWKLRRLSLIGVPVPQMLKERTDPRACLESYRGPDHGRAGATDRGGHRGDISACASRA